MKKRSVYRNLILTFLSMLSVYAVAAKEQLLTPAPVQQNFLVKALGYAQELLTGTSPAIVLAAALIIFLLHKQLFTGEGKASIVALITSGIFALFRVLGISFSIDNSLNYIIHSRTQSLHALLVFAGYWVLLYAVVKAVFCKIDTLHIREEHEQTRFARFLGKHVFGAAFLTMFVCWGVFWVLYFPGSLPHDGQNQLEVFFGARSPGQHHPYFATLVMGWIVSLGKAIHSYELGIALYVVFQSVTCASMFATECKYIHSKKVPLSAVVAAIAFFSVMPLFASYSQAVIKDTFYLGVFTCFALDYIRCYLKEGGPATIARMIGAGTLCCLYRNEAIYILSVALVVLLLISKGSRRMIAIVLTAVCALYATSSFIFTDVMRIPEGSMKEVLSIPLQQTARYVNVHEGEITEEERAIINEVIDYSILTTKYTPEKSDNVKNTWKKPTDEEFSAYLGLWFDMFQRDPVVYIEALLNHVFGYIDPMYSNIPAMQHQVYNKGPIDSAHKAMTFNTYFSTKGMRGFGTSYLELWNELPILSMLCFCGIYTWLGILLIANLLRKGNWRDALVFILPLMTLLICFVSPVNGYSRYMLPIMAIMPILCWFGLKNDMISESECRHIS